MSGTLQHRWQKYGGKILSSMHDSMDTENRPEVKKTAADRLTAVLFYAGLSIELAAVILDKSSWTNPYESMMFRAAFVLFAVRVLFCLKRFTKKELAFAAVCFVLGVVCWRCSGRNDLMRIVIFLCALRTVHVRKAALYSFFVTLAGSVSLMILAMTGVMGHLYQTYDYGHGLETRWDLGFGHPNSLHCMISMLIVFGLYLFEKRMKMYVYLLLMVGEILLFYLTRSNGGFLLGMSALVLSLVMHYGKRAAASNFLYITGELVLAAGLVFSVAAGILKPAEHRWLSRVDSLLTGRISTMWETTFHDGTLSTWLWFGSRLNQVYFDMGWLRIVYWYGVIPAVLVIILTFVLLRAIRQRRDRAAFVMFICCAVYTVFEAHLVSAYIGRNYLFFIAAEYLPVILAKTTVRPGTSGREAERKSAGSGVTARRE